MGRGTSYRNARRSRRGGSLIVAAVLLAGLSALAVSLTTVTTRSMSEQRGSREEVDAIFVAEAGIAEAMLSMEQGNGGVVGLENQPRELAGGTFFVTETDLGGGLTQLMATGRSGRSQARVELVLSEVSTNLFAWGAFGDEALTLDSNAHVDSYDSGAGAYEDQTSGSGSDEHANENGSVGSNGNVLALQNSKIWGDASAGPGHTTSVLGNATVSGSTAPNTSVVDLPPIVVPNIASSGAFTVANNGSATLGSGQHAFDSLYMNTGSTLTITGPATVVFGSFEIRSNAQFLADTSAGPVEIYVIDDFILNSNTLVAPLDRAPANLNFNLLSDNIIRPELEVDLDDVEFDSNARLYGTIYAPNAQIEIDSNFELFGSIVARRLTLDSNSKVHFDEALTNANHLAQTTYDRVCMRVLK